MVFSSHQQLRRRVGKSGTSRQSFIRQLLQEYQTSMSDSCKEQVLANLANFSYDPINYSYLRDGNIIDVFLTELRNPNVKDSRLPEFAISGLCNLCLDPLNRDAILNRNGIEVVSVYILFGEEKSVLLPALTTLLFLVDTTTKSLIGTPRTMERLEELCASKISEVRNTARILMEVWKRDT